MCFVIFNLLFVEKKNCNPKSIDINIAIWTHKILILIDYHFEYRKKSMLSPITRKLQLAVSVTAEIDTGFSCDVDLSFKTDLFVFVFVLFSLDAGTMDE